MRKAGTDLTGAPAGGSGASREPPLEIGEGPFRWAVVAKDGREFLIRAGRVKWDKGSALFYPSPPGVIDFDEQVIAMFSQPVSVVKAPA